MPGEVEPIRVATVMPLEWHHVMNEPEWLDRLIGANPMGIASDLADRYRHPIRSQNWPHRFVMAHEVIVQYLEQDGGEEALSMAKELGELQLTALQLAKFARPWREPFDRPDNK